MSLNVPAIPSDDGSIDLHELAVANPSFLVDKLGAECSDLQGLRELTVNALEAIAALDDDATGRAVWDLDWQRIQRTDGRQRKLSVTDTGLGMTPEQMRYFINHLAASGRQQARTGNFGVGAKIAAGSRNPHGLEYRSWHQGRGALVCFKRHPDGRWGLEPQRWGDGRTDYWRPLDEADKPWLLRGRDHGTQVVLLGRSPSHDTTQAPDSVTEARAHWITRYLNTRFLSLPNRVEVLVREGHQVKRGGYKTGTLRPITGQRAHLERRAQACGTLELSDALAHWWVLDDDHRGRRNEGLLWTSTGHAAAAFQDELYDLLPQTRGGYQRIQEFGVRFGYERIVLYVQPRVDDGRLEANTARTQLLLDHEPLPWARWADEFQTAMPDAIRQLQERIAGDLGEATRREAIHARLRAHRTLYNVSRYRPTRPPGGIDASQPPSSDATDPPAAPQDVALGSPGGEASATSEPMRSARGPASEPGASTVGEPDSMQPAEDVELPDVAWVSVRNGSRAPGDLEDRAARYHPDRHQLTINADFRVFADMTARWANRYRGIPGARAAVTGLVREWFEQTLVEAVLSARSVAESPEWSTDQLAALTSPAALTAAVLPRQLLDAQIKKRLAQRLGR